MRKSKILLIFVGIILSAIVLFLTSCGSCDNKFTNLLGSGSIGGGSGGGITLTNGAVHIDTNGTDWYNGALFDGNNYYITGWQDDGTMKYAIIKINPDLTLNYAKYYTASGATNIGLSNSFFNPNDNTKLYVGGWYNNDGIIGEIDKNTGNLNILKRYSNSGVIALITDNTNLYGVSLNGYIIKLNLSNLSIVGSKQISGYNFASISQNSNYIATYSYNYPYGVVIIKKDLSQAVNVNTNGDQHQFPIMDENYLYLIDKNSSNNLVISKIDISNLSSLSVSVSKEYSWNSLNGRYSGTILSDGNIGIGITTNETPNNLIFLKINKNDLSIMNQIKLSAKGGGNSQVVLNTMFPTTDGGFFVSRYINVGGVGYGLKMPSDFSLGTNCVFNVSNPGITENNYSYVINSNVPTLNSGGLTEIAIPTLTGVTVSTFVGCLSPAPNVMNNNVMNNNVMNNNELNNEDSLSGLNRNKPKK